MIRPLGITLSYLAEAGGHSAASFWTLLLVSVVLGSLSLFGLSRLLNEPRVPRSLALRKSRESVLPAEEPSVSVSKPFPLAGVDIIESGLPPLPDFIAYEMTIPIGYWTAKESAVVVFLDFSEISGLGTLPFATSVPYYREAGRWTVEASGVLGGWEFPFDPVAQPERAGELDGEAAVYGSLSRVQTAGKLPVWVATGRASTQVASIALVQGGIEDRRRLDSHFGAWVVCTEVPEPFEVVAFDSYGQVLARLPHPFRPGMHPDFR
jgi:hypothetical protein